MMDKGIKHTWDNSQDCMMATWNSEASEGPQRSMLGGDREWTSSVCKVRVHDEQIEEVLVH